MDRRDLLRTGGAALAAGLAGCAGLLGGTTTDGSTPDGDTATRDGTATTWTTTTTAAGGDPTFEVSMEPPTDPRVGEPHDLVVRVRNTGESSGTFADRLAVIAGEPASKPIEVGPVPPGGERANTYSIGFDTPGRHRVLLVETNVQTWLQVGGTALGTGVPLDDDVTFALESTRIAPATFVRGPGWGYRQDPVTDLVGAGAEGPPRAVVLLRGTVTNDGDTATEFDPAPLSIGTTDGATAVFLRGGTTPAGIDHAQLRLPDGTPSLVGTRLDPGDRTRGFLACTLPRSTATDPLVVRAGDGETPEAVWSIGDASARSLPRFVVRDVTVPGEMETGRDRSFTVTVANGGAAGQFRGIIQDNVHHDVYTTVGSVEGTVESGDRVELEGTLRLPWNYERHLRLRPSGTWTTVQAGIARRAYGESYRMPNGVTVTVLSPHYSDTIEFVDDRNNFSHGFWTVLVTADLPEEAQGESKGSELLPGAGDFRCKRMARDEANFPYSQDHRVEFGDVAEHAREHGNTIVRPVQGPLYPLDPPAEPAGGRVTGWMPIIIGPEERHWPVDELEVQLIENVHREFAGYTAGWSGKFKEN